MSIFFLLIPTKNTTVSYKMDVNSKQANLSINLQLKIIGLKKVLEVQRQLVRFWIHFYSPERQGKASVCYLQQGIGQ